jgi:hypothetical protein
MGWIHVEMGCFLWATAFFEERAKETRTDTDKNNSPATTTNPNAKLTPLSH